MYSYRSKEGKIQRYINLWRLFESHDGNLEKNWGKIKKELRAKNKYAILVCDKI